MGKAVESLLKGGLLLGKMQPDQMIHRLIEEAGAGHRAHAHLFRQILAEDKIAFIAVFRNIQQHIIRALGIGVGDLQIIQPTSITS